MTIGIENESAVADCMAPTDHVNFVTHPINILIVDDEPKNLTVLESILTSPNYRIVRAESADQALLALVAEEFALLILDIRMPGMTGLELAHMVKNRKKTASIPIIFLTAYYNEDQHVLDGYETGAVDYLNKPVNPAILRSKVAVFAELHRNSRELEAVNRQLTSEVAERRLVEEQLVELNNTLEQRVAQRTKDLQEADRRKNEFLATLAHELRNPLAPIRTAIQLMHLSEGGVSETQWARSVIDRQVQHMTRLIDELMDVARVNSGRIELKPQRIGIATAVNHAVETSRPLIEENGHHLLIEMPEDSIWVNADLTRLGQVFVNILNNAAKFSKPAGSIRLKVERDGDHVTVVVTDSGIGIPTDKLETIFRLFSQVEDALSRSKGGLGIGLCLAKTIVEMHGGTIKATSSGLGTGSQFSVSLPVVADYTPNKAQSEEAEELRPPVVGKRLLVVDDNVDACEAFAKLLVLMGHTVFTAHNGMEAVEKACLHRPEVCFLDIGLPGLNGYEVAHAIRKEKWGELMTLIAVTGWGQDADRQRSSEAGFNKHLVKPVDPREIAQLLNMSGESVN